MRKTFTTKAHFSELKMMMVLFSLLLLGLQSWGQTPYVMSGGNYSEDFLNIANTTNWPNGFNGTDCAEWKSVAVNASGTVGDGIKISTSTATFSTGSSGGVQRGTANINLLSTSTANSCAIDLLLDFTGRNGGTISFDVATVFNSTGNRDSKLKLFYSTDNITFTEITGTNLPYTARNNVASSASITTIALPSAFNNSATARLRLYEYSTTTGGLPSPTGSQPKISVDNIVVTSTPSGGSAPTLNADISNNNVDNNIDITFTPDAIWEAAITAVKIGGTALNPATDYAISSGNIQLIPSGSNPLLTTSGSKAVTVIATGYTDGTVTQQIDAGAPTDNSTSSIDLPLTSGASRTITCTAKDHYNNLVSGYTFKYDASITDNIATTTESYTLDGAAITTTANDISVVSTTNGSGVATFTAALPATVDGADGISIQVQLNNGDTNIGSAYSFYQLQSQTITFGVLSAVTYGDSPFTVSATGGGSGNPVVFTSSDNNIATCTGTDGTTITIIANGNCTIYANQAGNGSYNAAPQVGQPLTVNQKTLTIPDAVAQDKVYTGTDAAIINGTLTGKVGADVVTFNGTGTFADVNVASGILVTSTCTLAGVDNGKYTLTQPTGLSASITPASQVITFPALVNKVLGDPDYNPGATSATSGINPITYASSNGLVATIVANQIHIVGVGSTTITASQGSSTNYSAAIDVPQNLTVLTPPIAAWDFSTQTGGTGNFGTSPLPVSTKDANLTVGGLTRGSGFGTLSGTGAASAWGSVNFTASGTLAGEIAANKYFTFTIAANPGYSTSLSGIGAYNIRRSATGPSTGQWQYKIGSGSFVDIGTPITWGSVTSSSGNPQSAIDLSGFSDLQNVVADSTITFRLVCYGASGTGGSNYLKDLGNTTGNDLLINGVVEIVTPPATPTVVWIDDDYTSGSSGGHVWGYDAFATIQEGINAVDINGSVNVASGTYEENITINKSVTINGAGQGSTIVVPAVSDPGGDGGPSLSNSQVMVVSAHDVTISNLTIDGYNPLLSPVTPVIRNGVRIDARNGVIESDGPWNNLHVTYVTVKNIYLRGIYARSGGTGFHFDHNTVENVDGGGSSIAIFNFGGSGVIENNTVTTVNDGISSNWSTGTQYLHNIVTDSKGYGIHSDNNGTVADYIHGNIINSPNTDTWGIMVFFPRNVNLIVDSNTVNNAMYGLVAYGGDNPSTGTASFTNNIIDGQNKTNSSGIIVITGQNAWIPYGYYVGSVGASFTGNTISNTNYGLQIESETGYSAIMTALSGNTITGSVEDITVWGLGTITSSGFAGNKVEVLNPGKIQIGINVAATGGTVNVDAGTFAGNINVNKSLTIIGDPGDALPGTGPNAPVIDGGSLPGDAFLLANGVTNVTIEGFEMRNFTSPDLDGIGNGISAWEASTSNITIQDNYFHHLGYNGILVGNDDAAGDHTNWLVKNNVIEDFGYIGFELTNTSNSSIENNEIHMATPYIGAIFSSARRSETGLTVKENLIDGTPSTLYPVIYVYAYDNDMPNPNLNTVLIENNKITTVGTPAHIYIRNIGTGTVTGVQVHGNSLTKLKNNTSASVDATCNWWGTTDPSVIAANITGSGSVTYIPYNISDGGACSGVPAPTGPGSQTYCSNENKIVSDLTLTLSGTAIKWYSAASGGIVYSPSILLVTGSYFASQTIGGIESTDRKAVAVTVHTALAPSFTQLGPFSSGSYVPVLRGTSNNGITGAWNPPTISTATIGKTVYTFTPTSGQCANTATMTIEVIPPITSWVFNGDIGTCVQIYWPLIPTAANYAFQYRIWGTPGTGGWIGTSTNTFTVKLGNLTPGQHYEFRVKGYLADGSPVSGLLTNDYTTSTTTYNKDMDMGTALMVMWDDYSPWASTYTVQYKKASATSWSVLPVGNMPVLKLVTEPGANYVTQVVVYHAGSLWGTTAPYSFTADAYGSSVANATGTSIDLTWTNFNQGDPAPWVVNQYIRYRIKNSSSAWLQAYAAGGTNTVHLTGLTPNTDYEFQVHVYLPDPWGSTPLGFFNSGAVKVINTNISNNSINVYPNPFVEQVNMDLFTENETNVIWNIYDMTGKVVLNGNESITSGYSTLSIRAENLPKGVYLLKAIMDDQMQSFRIMKQ